MQKKLGRRIKEIYYEQITHPEVPCGTEPSYETSDTDDIRRDKSVQHMESAMDREMMKSDLKETIAKQFLNDSQDFLKRYRLLRDISVSSHIGMRSKLFLDLVFSAECSIKGLVFLVSTESDIQIIYKNILTHNLNTLIEKLPGDEKNKCLSYMDQYVLNYSIGNRYMIEAYKTYQPNGILGKVYYETIANCEWLNSVYEKLKELKDYVWSKVKVPVEEFNFLELDGESCLLKHGKIMSLHK